MSPSSTDSEASPPTVLFTSHAHDSDPAAATGAAREAAKDIKSSTVINGISIAEARQILNIRESDSLEKVLQVCIDGLWPATATERLRLVSPE